MRIADLIGPDRILPRLRATSRGEVLRELAEFLATGHPELEAEAIVRALENRERQGSTAVGGDLAIPHARMGSISELVACLARSPRGIDYDSPDGEPTRFFFALLAPPDVPGSHLQALARVSKLFKGPQTRERLRSADGAREIFAVVTSEDERLA